MELEWNVIGLGVFVFLLFCVLYTRTLYMRLTPKKPILEYFRAHLHPVIGIYSTSSTYQVPKYFSYHCKCERSTKVQSTSTTYIQV